MGTWEGLGLPAYGEFYRYDNDQVQTLYVEESGIMNLTVANTTDSMDNTLAITNTYSGTVTGYGNTFYANLQVGGTSSGGASATQYNAFGADITINGTHASGIGGIYVYICEGTATLTDAEPYGGWFDIMELGATNKLSCIRLSKQNTTLGTSVDAFIHCALDGSGTARSLIHMEGTGRPTYFLSHTASTAGGYLDATAGQSGDTPVGRIAVLNNAEVVYLYLFAAT